MNNFGYLPAPKELLCKFMAMGAVYRYCKAGKNGGKYLMGFMLGLYHWWLCSWKRLLHLVWGIINSVNSFSHVRPLQTLYIWKDMHVCGGKYWYDKTAMMLPLYEFENWKLEAFDFPFCSDIYFILYDWKGEILNFWLQDCDHLVGLFQILVYFFKRNSEVTESAFPLVYYTAQQDWSPLPSHIWSGDNYPIALFPLQNGEFLPGDAQWKIHLVLP